MNIREDAPDIIFTFATIDGVRKCNRQEGIR